MLLFDTCRFNRPVLCWAHGMDREPPQLLHLLLSSPSSGDTHHLFESNASSPSSGDTHPLLESNASSPSSGDTHPLFVSNASSPSSGDTHPLLESNASSPSSGDINPLLGSTAASSSAYPQKCCTLHSFMYLQPELHLTASVLHIQVTHVQCELLARQLLISSSSACSCILTI